MGIGNMIGVVVAIMLFMSGMIIVNIIRDDVTTVRSSSGLDCTNSSISDGSKLSCLAIDLAIPYLLIVLISLAGGLFIRSLIK